MNILITGFTPRSANPKFRRRIGIAQLLEAGYRAAGHKVQCGSWFPGDLDEPFPDDYDLVIVGLSSPLAPSASYTYPAMLTLERLWGQDRLVLFPEDPATWKIKNGTLSALRDHSRLYSNYLSSRAHYMDIFSDDEALWDKTAELQRRVLQAAAYLLTKDPWPTYLVPAFKDADLDPLLDYAPPGARRAAVPIDFTQLYRTHFDELHEAIPSTVDVWLTESKPTDAGLNTVITANQRVEVHAYDDAAFSTALAPALGVLEHSKEYGKLPGSWSSTPAIAATVESFFHGWAETYDRLGNAYRVLPTAYEDMSWNARQETLTWQSQTLDKATTPLAEVMETLVSLVREKR